MRPLPNDMLERLRHAGFVHVTGIRWTLGGYIIRAPESKWGMFELRESVSNYNVAVLVTEDGQVWAAINPRGDYSSLAKILCPGGLDPEKRFYKRLSEGVLGGNVSLEAMLLRITDPYRKI